jgi:hypothetical protein
MKNCLLLFCAFILLISCSKQTREQTKSSDTGNLLVEEFQHALSNKKEIVFKDSSHLGATTDGAILDLHFFTNSQLMAYTWGNGFSYYSGTYTFPGNNRVEIHLKDQNWPELVLSKEGERFQLKRTDGLRSLTKHIIFTNKDGTRSLINDGDIYPEAESRIFPFTQRIDNAAKDSAAIP